MPKILVIEDDSKTANAIRTGLRGEGYDAAVAKTGEDGFFRLNAETFDLVVLDWMLPGRDGIEILKSIRAHGTKTPVLLLTARDAIEDRVLPWFQHFFASFSMPARRSVSACSVRFG